MITWDCGGDGCPQCRAKRARQLVELPKPEPRKLTLLQLDLNTGRMVPLDVQPQTDRVFYVQADGIVFSITKADAPGIEVAVTGRGDSNRSLICVHPRSGNVVRIEAVEP